MKTTVCLLALGVLCLGCGNNLAGPAGTPLLVPPGALKALSLDSAHVRLFWSAPSNVSDTSFAAYLVSWGTNVDTAARTALQWTSGVLGRGATTFSIRSLLKKGETSDAATITWAPAWRFDAVPIVVTEYNSAQPSGASGVDVGTSTSNPVAVGLLDLNADSTLDFYLSGPAGSPLQLLSAAVYDPGWHQTLFSTISTASQDLDAPLSSFPADNTFQLQNLTIVDNTIYYMKVQGNAGEVNYARVHVHVLPGDFPNRQVEIRISLQKVSRLPYA